MGSGQLSCVSPADEDIFRSHPAPISSHHYHHNRHNYVLHNTTTSTTTAIAAITTITITIGMGRSHFAMIKHHKQGGCAADSENANFEAPMAGL